MSTPLDISKLIAGISFILGTLLLVLFLFLKSELIISIGICYVAIAVIVNSLFFLGLVARLIADSENRLDLIKAIGITLINFPIAFGYFFIVINTL